MRRCLLMLLLILAPGCTDDSGGGMFVPEEALPAAPVTNPVIIPSSKVDPEYPEAARVARVEGNVVLQATIATSGAVTEIQVLRTNNPGWGFEDASIAAVMQWRYEPALQNGQPVEVLFTVIVEFTLH